MPGTLAIVVCSRDRPETLRDCLRQVVEQGIDEIVVVDSASTTPATATVAGDFDVQCVRSETPGLAHARNVAMRATSADRVAFTDDDCRPAPGWAAALRGAPEIAAGGRTGFVVGRVAPGGPGEPVSVLLDAVPRSYGPSDDPSHIGHGANLAVSRECWEDLGGFDDLLGVGSRLRSGEDTDFFWRALRGGWTGHYEPAAVVTHQQWRSRRAALQTSYGYGIGAGAVRTKVRRLAGSDAAHEFRAGSVTSTLRQAGTDLRNGYQFGIATCLSRTAGIVVGRAAAARLSLVHGHLAPR